MSEIDGRGAGGNRARHATSGGLAALVFTGGITPPRRLDRHRVGNQRAERRQDADERERDQSSNHAFNVLPRLDPSSDRQTGRTRCDHAPRARRHCCYARAARREWRDQPRSNARLISVSAQSIASLGFEAFVTTRANMLGMM